MWCRSAFSLGVILLTGFAVGVLPALQCSKLTFDPLIGFYCKRIDSQFEGLLRRVQTRGNAIHHFQDAKIGTQEELLSDIAEFLQFLLAVNSRLPYHDDIYDPQGRRGLRRRYFRSTSNRVLRSAQSGITVEGRFCHSLPVRSAWIA